MPKRIAGFTNELPTRKPGEINAAKLARQLGTKMTKGNLGLKTFDGLVKALGGKEQMDHWKNVLTGIGMKGQDKRMGGNVGITIPFREYEVEEIYTADNLARRIVELIPFECLRRGFQFTGIDEEPVTKINKFMDQKAIVTNFKTCGEWARLYGGSGAFMIVDDGRKPWEPLDIRNIRSFDGIVPLSRWELWTQYTDLETNIASPNFNKPKIYYLQPRRGLPFTYEKTGSNARNYPGANEGSGADFKFRNRVEKPITRALQGQPNMKGQEQIIQYNSPIHSSRVIRFDGKPLPIRKRAQNVYWDDSVFTSLFEALRDYQVSHGYIANIISDFSVAVMKIEAFASLLDSEGGDSQVTKLLEIMQLFRSVLGAIAVGPEDSYEWQSRTTTGLPELIEKLAERLQAYTDIPSTILFNKSPSGLGATGNHEMEVWFNVIQAHQKLYYEPRFMQILEVIFMAKNGPTGGKIPDGWGMEWVPLWQPSEQDQATTRKTIADTDNIYDQIGGGALGEEIINQRFGGSKFNPHLRLQKKFVKPEPEVEDPEKPGEQMDGLGKIADPETWNMESDKMDAAGFTLIDARMKDTAPPGWQGTVEKMKSHGNISNPFALAWWLYGNGYSPHA